MEHVQPSGMPGAEREKPDRRRRASAEGRAADGVPQARAAEESGLRPRLEVSIDREPPPPDFAFPPHASTSSPDAPPPFTFGTFQMNESTGEMVGTPTAELGAFEYPFDAAVSPAIRRLVQDEQLTDPLLLPPGFHPGLRRTSSTSTLPISPAAGRRPSVVHSNTVPQAEVGRRFSLISGDGTGMGPHSASAVVQAVEEEEAWRDSEDVDGARRRSSANSLGGGGFAASPTAGRRPSILAFAHQPLPDTPIPPSLAHLAPQLRRGSIPAHHWPARDRQSSVSTAGSPMRAGSIGAASGHTAAVVRNSLSGPVFTHRGTREEHVTVSSAYLYQRRSSLASTSRGLLSSKTPLPVPRPGLLPNQQRPSVSSSGSSSGSRESVMTVRDLRNSFDVAEGRPPLARDGSNDSTATERSRRMSMPALASPSPTMDAVPPNWTTYPTDADGGFSFPPQVSSARPSQPFTLGQPPSPRVGASGPGTDSDRASTSSGSSKAPHAVGISSSSEDLSDAQDDPPTRRGFRISPRGIEARERRRSSRLSTLAAAGSGNTLETIPSDYVVDFSRSARSSFSGAHHGAGKLADGRQAQLGGVSALSTSSSEESEERVERKPGTEGHEDPSDVEDGGVGTITTAFRAFAFPPRNSVQEGR